MESQVASQYLLLKPRKLNLFKFLIPLSFLILGIFWFESRYPSLLSKANTVKESENLALASLILDKTIQIVPNSWHNHFPQVSQIIDYSLSWMWAMKYGMTFGVFFGAVILTLLQSFSFSAASNWRQKWLTTLKGFLTGVPMGVCANCSVPISMGLSRSTGKVELGLAHLFTSPSFNPVILAMMIIYLPTSMILYKYTILLTIIFLIVPLIGSKFTTKTSYCEIQTTTVSKLPIYQIYLKNLQKLFVPTITMMLVAALASSIIMIAFPLDMFFHDLTIGKAALLSLISTIAPVPIAMDVMLAQYLLVQTQNTGAATLIFTTLGTFSIVPMVYIGREFSWKIAFAFAFAFWLIGLIGFIIL